MAFALRLERRFRANEQRFPWLREHRRGGFFRCVMRFLRKATGGAAAVEFAIVGPVLIALIMGICSYGSYFLAAHTVQQLANDAARAAIAGLDDTERQTIAQRTVATELADQRWLRADASRVLVTRADTTLSVNVSYNGSADLWSHMLVPAPSQITRTASIQLGGY